MSREKRRARQEFRQGVLDRDGHRCVICGVQPGDDGLDAHHIIDRHDMPNGGYVKENGVTLCHDCHPLAEREHQGLDPVPGLSRAELFAAIGSSEEEARHADR
tara:strand:+ start:18752 stop:19060 length:309 start_codon:yes stop_codon:yes gene_type:complete